jgi:hypothetical protein
LPHSRSSDHCFDFAGVRVERNQRGLRRGLLFRNFRAVLFLACLELLFDERQAMSDCFNSAFWRSGSSVV